MSSVNGQQFAAMAYCTWYVRVIKATVQKVNLNNSGAVEHRLPGKADLFVPMDKYFF